MPELRISISVMMAIVSARFTFRYIGTAELVSVESSFYRVHIARLSKKYEQFHRNPDFRSWTVVCTCWLIELGASCLTKNVIAAPPLVVDAGIVV